MSTTAHGCPITAAEIALMIDHSLLRPELTLAEVIDGCDVAAAHKVASVCCKPADVLFAARRLRGTPVGVGTVVAFPHGSSTTATKVEETKRAIDDDATEIDMVLNIGRLREGRGDEVCEDIAAVVAVAKDANVLTKVIFENAYLNEAQIVRACRLAEEAGAAFVKTSTGFAPSGATLADLRLMRRSVGPTVQVKAAGGVRSLDTLLAMMAEGATRFGATATVSILAEAERRAHDGDLVIPAVTAMPNLEPSEDY
jgi:deoxyribose-phosphate aldolase